MFPQTSRAAIAIAALLIATSSFAAEVELKGSWTKGRRHWLIHIQLAGPGFFIGPNSPAFDNERLIQVTDAATGQSVPFRLRHDKQRMMRSIDLAFPELQRPMSVVVSVGGLSVVDQNGRRVDYQQSLAVRAPASGDDHARPTPAASPGHFHHNTYGHLTKASPGSSAEPLIDGGAGPEDLGPPVEVGEGAPPTEPEIPQFPFPPPQASAFENIPRDLLVARQARPKLKDVDNALSAAFQKCGYGEKSFYAVPDGFAMASRIEQINADGSFSQNRWALATAVMNSFSIESYLRALFQSRAGRFRVIVFMVTNHPFQQTEVQVSSEQAKAWVKKGLSELPKKIGDRDFTDDYACTALIYEFKTLGGREATFVDPSEISAQTHLEKAGLLSAFTRSR